MRRVTSSGWTAAPMMGKRVADPPCVPLPGYPLLATTVPAGVPVTADAHVAERLCLDAHLVAHQDATFVVRVAGGSMLGLASTMAISC